MPELGFTSNSRNPIFPRYSAWIVAAAALFGCNSAGPADAGVGGVGSTAVAMGGTGGTTTSNTTSAGGILAQGGQTSAFGGSTVILAGGTSSSGGSGTTMGGTVAKGGTSATGGAASKGGNSTIGGATSGGVSSTGGATARGGSSTTTGGVSPTGGATARGGSSTTTGGATSTGGSNSAGGTTSSGAAFSQCRFHFGTIDTIAKNGGSAMISQLDFFTPGWMGTNGDTFDQTYVCDEGKSGGTLGNLVPVVVAYIAAGYVKRHHNLCDGNVSGCSGGDLGKNGAQYITQDWSAILTEYKAFATGYANCFGTTRPIVFEMEPDWYQYTVSTQTAPWTAAQAGSKMTELVNALKASLPNARFSIDVSPWVGSNGSDNGSAWFSNFNMALFTFVNTSGGGTNANTTKLRSSNNMTWSGLNTAAGKPILADTGYGANGISAGHDPNWDVVANINARVGDGVISIAQYNPNSSWGTTISGIRSQLSTPKYCP